MRRATENTGKTRTITDYFYPRTKVKDLGFQQHSSVPHLASILQEAPMQPSRVPNHLLPDPSPRGMLPLKGPERCHLERLASPLCSPHFRGPIHSLSPTNPGSPVNRSHLTPRDRLGPLQPVATPPTRSLCSPRLAPVSSTDGVASPQFMKDLSNHSLSPHIGRGQTTGPRITVCYPGGRTATVQRLESNKAQSQDVRSRSPMQTVQLKRPPIGALLNTRAHPKACLVPLSDPDWGRSQSTQWECKPFHNTHLADRSRGSRLPIMQSAVAPCQDRQLKLTPSSEKFIPAVDLNCSSEKRRRESEDGDDGSKKLCSQSLNSGKAQTPEPTNSFCTSLASQPPPRPSSVSELLPKTTDSPSTEPAYGLSTPTQSSCAPLSTKHCITRQPMGAKQAYINAVQTHPMKVIELSSPSKLSLKKRREDNDKRKLCASLSYEGPPRDTGSSPYFNSNCHNTDHTRRRASIPTVKTLSREDSAESDNGTLKPASNSHSGSQNGRTLERNKTAHSRRHSFQNDYEELFTPDPLTYVVSNGQKTAKPKMEGGTITPEKMFSPSTQTSSSSNSLTGSSCQKTQSATVTSSTHSVDTNIFPQVSSSSQPRHPHVSMPTVTLQRVKLEDLRSLTPEESVHKRPSVGPKDIEPALSGTDTAASEKSSTTSQCSLPPLKERQASREGRKQVNEEDPIDVELDLDLGLSFAVDLDLTQDSHSSEEEQLISLQEMMKRVTKPPPDTPEKGAFSEPSTPGHHSSQTRTQNFPPATKSANYKNTLDQMLEEINTNKKAKEIETQLLTACEEDLLRLAEYEEAEETREEGISSEHQEFLQRYSLMSNAIKEVAPGEVVFNLEKFGRIFDQDTLQLRKCMVNPQGTVQKTLLWSSPAQLKLWVNIELFQEAYDSRSPCPTQVTRFLFKMMSVHSERLVSENILQALCDIACTAAYQIVKNDSKQFQVWMPSLADVALVLMNMGVAFVTLFPFENFQPRFTEGDLLEDVYIKSESPSSNKKEPRAFPGHNCNNIFKYLSYCMGLCPRAYSDNELLLLMTVVGRVGLESRLILQSSVELYPFMYQIVYNFRDWDTMLPRICQALTDLTGDHHNMCLVVQLLPDNTRGKQLRRHLSLAMISKLLDGTCTYTPREEEMQLSELRPFLPRMQPSALLRGLRSRTTRQDQEEDMVTLDQQSYYLCYSLLTLANETSNFQFFPAHQKEQLMFLCSELETHIKCDIRESEKCLYRSKVKDLVARIYTKWQMLLQRTRPLHGKLYDYWQPLFSDTLTSSQEDHVVNNNNNDDNGEMSDMDEEEEEEEDEEELDEDKERSDTEHNDVEMTAEDEETQDGDDTEHDRNKMADNDTKPEETEDDIKGEDDDTNKPEAIQAGDAEEDQNNILDDTNKPKDVDGDNTGDDTNNLEGMQSDDDTVNYVIESEEATESESVHGELSGEMPDTETPVLNKDSEVKEAEAETTERTEVVDTENLVNENASQEPDSVV